jgi:hypothetical protein
MITTLERVLLASPRPYWMDIPKKTKQNKTKPKKKNSYYRETLKKRKKKKL